MASLRFQEQSKAAEQQLIDEEEQKKIIANYEKQDEAMSRRAKLGVGVLVVVLTCVALFCAVMEIVSPVHLPFHAPFRELYPTWTIIIIHLLSAIGHITCYIGSTHSIYNKIGVALSLLVFLYWSYGLYVWNHLLTEELWLPLVNPLTLLLCWYTTYISASLKSDIVKLKNFTYKYKSV